MPAKISEKWLIIIAFATVYIIWGSTYLGNEYAIDFIPPWLMAGTRFSLAGAILITFMWFWKWEKTTLNQWKNCGLLGILLMTFGVGGTVWAQQFVDSGITSLLVGMSPLMVLLMVWIIEKRKPKPKGILGVSLGLVGLYLLVNQNSVLSVENAGIGVIMILICVSCWAFGTVIIPKLDLPNSKVQSAGMQMFIGGSTLLIFSLISGEGDAFKFEHIPWQSWVAWGYLIFFGSIAAFTAFNYLLVKVSPEQVSTTAYVNPVIAVFLGWFMRDEILTSQTGIAAALMLIGVFFINDSKKEKRKI